MIVAWLALAAFAEPGRTVGGVALTTTGQEPVGARATLEYGITRRLSVHTEAGVLGGALSAGLGPRFDVVRGTWVRLGVHGMPEVVLPLGPREVFGLPLVGRSRLVGRVGLRGSWLAFWGLSITGHGDWIQPVDGAPGHAQLGAGLSVRM
jgi:hypothetical protein